MPPAVWFICDGHFIDCWHAATTITITATKSKQTITTKKQKKTFECRTKWATIAGQTKSKFALSRDRFSRVCRAVAVVVVGILRSFGFPWKQHVTKRAKRKKKWEREWEWEWECKNNESPIKNLMFAYNNFLPQTTKTTTTTSAAVDNYNELQALHKNTNKKSKEFRGYSTGRYPVDCSTSC